MYYIYIFSGDIDRQDIQYVLNPGENASSDSFFFKVSDKGKSKPQHSSSKTI